MTRRTMRTATRAATMRPHSFSRDTNQKLGTCSEIANWVPALSANSPTNVFGDLRRILRGGAFCLSFRAIREWINRCREKASASTCCVFCCRKVTVGFFGEGHGNRARCPGLLALREAHPRLSAPQVLGPASQTAGPSFAPDVRDDLGTSELPCCGRPLLSQQRAPWPR